jgi:DNA-directed RNA polymerase subunit RPC12/RpoP
MNTNSPTHKTCAKCGASFKRSPADTTVNCPDCRTRPATRESVSTSSQVRSISDRFYSVGREDGREGREPRTDPRCSREGSFTADSYKAGYERGSQERA